MAISPCETPCGETSCGETSCDETSCDETSCGERAPSRELIKGLERGDLRDRFTSRCSHRGRSVGLVARMDRGDVPERAIQKSWKRPGCAVTSAARRGGGARRNVIEVR
jgi:hypothetical protein